MNAGPSFMRRKEQRLPVRWVLMALAALVVMSAQAQEFPTRPIRLIVPFPPGGGTDVVARAIAPKMSEVLGQPVVVDNHAGAGGNIGAELVAKAPPDGYTILLAASTMAVNVTLMPDLPFDPRRDFSPIVLLLMNQSVLIVNPKLPVSNVRDFIALAKSKPGELTYGSSGNGSGAHLAGEMFKSMAGVNLVHVPYKGAAPAMTDLIAGHIDAMIIDLAIAMPHVKAGTVKALAIGSAQRFEPLGDVPTISEAGVPGFEISGLMGLVAPSGTPRDAIARLNAAANRSLENPQVRQQLTAIATIPMGGSPERLEQVLRADIEKYGRVVRAARMKVD
jgi:tripartite-type tricarboxylate transporter receptor subunit TctC